ncbi:hypothetical protein GCM10009422_18190 [Brevundimonas kwangchunensis]|uniref:Type IV secretion system protein n=1 Tax=Brevundimonas kwangchunensis TaxID=322163 RepID=A0ABN1GXV3_9CAUL
MSCSPLVSGDQFLSSLLRHLDCQGRTLGAVGYEALAAPGSPVTAALTAALVIAVALYGMRLALGDAAAPVRGSVILAARVGIVLTLAASWPAFQTVVFDVITRGPDQIAGLISPARSGIGRTETLILDLQAADQAIMRLTNLGTGRVEFSALPAPGADPSEPPQRIPINDNPAFGWARILFLSAAVAGFAVTRLAAGVLLALAPLFAGLLLFGAARGLFIGWVRALIFTALASLALTLILTIEVRLLMPWIEGVIIQRQARVITPSVPTELLVLCLSFAIGLVGVFAFLLRTSFMTHVPTRPLREIAGRLIRAAELRATPPVASPPVAPDAPPSRALVIADAVAAAQRRETAGRRSPTLRTSDAPRRTLAAAVQPTGDDLVIPDFGAAGRRARSRTSLGARLRDRRA